MNLFTPQAPVLPPEIRIVHGDSLMAVEAAKQAGGPDLIVADPPWGEYSQNPGGAAPDHQYPVLSLDEIRAHVAAAAAVARPDCRLAMWATWPLLVDALGVGPTAPWRYITGGAWSKARHPGVGYHWLGRSEPVLVWGRGSPYIDRSQDLGNAYTSVPGEHSAKPEEWHAAWLRRWTRPGDLVLDLYCGLGSMARACQAEGRRYIGAEIDAERHAAAVSFTAQRRSRA